MLFYTVRHRRVLPSVSEIILDKAINFAKQYADKSDENLRIIKHCRQSLLYNNYEPWEKKDTDSCFDVTMEVTMVWKFVS